ncbi:MAG: alkaline phosphatase D family protein [Sporichthyaceae bacterium]
MPTRRTFVQGTSMAGLALVAPGRRLLAEPAPARRIAEPFTLGVASGEPTADSVVLWTRLAPRPMESDGHGGMPDRTFDVEWQLATDPEFKNLVREGVESATRADAHSVHVEPRGLTPSRDYWYRFRVDGHVSPAGRTRTAPADDAREPVDFAIASCAFWEQGWFTVYRHIADSQPDLVLHLGDYLYEYGPRFKPPPSGIVREHVGGHLKTLAQFRRRHAQYRGDADLQAAHAAAPWVVTPDDHEVADNWNGENATDFPDPVEFARLRAVALRAYWEHMPMRPSAHPNRRGLPIFRRIEWGQTATFHVLDTRQFRDRQGCNDGRKLRCIDGLPQGRTILGREQEAWLAKGLAASSAAWQFLAQQVQFAQVPRQVDNQGRRRDEPWVSNDDWNGYPGARERLLMAARNAEVRNLVVLTGDAHVHWAADIHPRGTAESGPPVAVELVTSAVTTGGDLIPKLPWVKDALARNSHLKYWDGRRGWIRCRADGERMIADFKVVEKVSEPGSPATTSMSFEVQNGRAGLRQR